MANCTIKKYFFVNIEGVLSHLVLKFLMGLWKVNSPSLGVAVLRGICVHALSVCSISDTAVDTEGILFCFSKQQGYLLTEL